MESRGVLTAGIIGDEILKGHVQDTNSHYLARNLWALGIRVVKVTVIGDDIDTIAQEVKHFSGQYDYVLTCGGIGPTHDDVTMKGIARSFDEDVYPHPDLLKLFYGHDVHVPQVENDPVFKETLVPKSTVVHGGSACECPLLVTHNVYTYAGLPSAMKETFENNKHVFKTSQSRFYLKQIFYSIEEEKIAKPLTELQNEFKSIQVGSYPNDELRSSHRVKVTLEGLDMNLVDKAYYSSLLKISHEAVISVKNSWSHSGEQELKASLEWLENHFSSRGFHIAPFSLLERMNESLKILEEAIQIFKPENICIAFTGGKDCTVLLALYNALLEKLYREDAICSTKALYIVPKNSFSEVDEFIDQCTEKYKIDLIKINGSIREGLGHLKSSHPNIEAILMGTRYSDPHSSELSSFTSTDPGWPQYTRVNCVLEWTYSQIWVFLRLFKVPYCKLYDKGYTSLGDNKDTKPNPALSSECEGNDCLQYEPAYCLIDETLERAGRINSNNGKSISQLQVELKEMRNEEIKMRLSLAHCSYSIQEENIGNYHSALHLPVKRTNMPLANYPDRSRVVG